MEVIPNDARIITWSFEPEFQAICRLDSVRIQGGILIEMKPKEVLLEVDSIHAFLDTLVDQPTTVEDFARTVFDAIVKAVGETPLRVTVRGWTTEHSPIEASISQGEI